MAVVTAIASPVGSLITLRNVAAQADIGQTDWISVPQWALYAICFLNLTAVAGTTPELTPSFLALDPVSRDDTHVVQIHGNFTSVPITAAAQSVITIGPGVTGIADDLALAATGDSTGFVGSVLPPILGVKLLLDRTSGTETYTYTLAMAFRG